MATAEKTAATTAARTAASDQRIVIDGVRWKTYNLLIADLADRRTPRICFEQGRLEIVSPSDEREQYRRLIARLIDLWTLENRIAIRGLGSTKFKRDASQRAVERDECYYISHEAVLRGRRGIDLETDPPPDLAVEIDVTGDSAGKLELYAALGVPEVWRFARQTLYVYRLGADGKYKVVEESPSLPGFPVKDVAHWIARGQELDETALAIAFQESIRCEQGP